MDRRIVLIVGMLIVGAMSNIASAQQERGVADSDLSTKDSTAAIGLDLDKLLTDSDDDLLVSEEPAAKPNTAVDSAAVIAPSSETLPNRSQIIDAENNTAPQILGRRGAPSSRADSSSIGPAFIEDGRTINFAQNLKEYRSPKMAMLLSLLVPGLGQAYSRSYIKAGAFGAVEIASIAVAVYFNSVGKTKKREAYDFADMNFDVEKMRTYENRLSEEFEKLEIADTVNFNFPIYYKDSSFYAAIENDKKPSYFYEIIRDGYFAQGWNDSDPSIDKILNAGATDTIYGDRGGKYMLYFPEVRETFYLIRRIADISGNPIDDTQLRYGYSSYQEKYNSMMKDANSYSDAVNYTLYVLLINHIVSAIDAGFTARAYNARLLGNDNSAWERISVSQQYVFTGSEMSPGIALRVKF